MSTDGIVPSGAMQDRNDLTLGDIHAGPRPTAGTGSGVDAVVLPFPRSSGRGTLPTRAEGVGHAHPRGVHAPLSPSSNNMAQRNATPIRKIDELTKQLLFSCVPIFTAVALVRRECGLPPLDLFG